MWYAVSSKENKVARDSPNDLGFGMLVEHVELKGLIEGIFETHPLKVFIFPSTSNANARRMHLENQKFPRLKCSSGQDFKCMLAWLRNVNIAILVSHVSWNVLTSSTLLAQPCICTIVLNGHAHISNLHCQFLCCCALLQVKISLKICASWGTGPSHQSMRY